MLASAGVLGHGVCLWDTATGQPLQRLSVPSMAKAVAFSPDGKWLVAAGYAVCLIDVATGKELRRFQASGKFLDLDVVAFSPDGRTVAAGETRGARAFGNQGSAVILWDAGTGKELHRLAGHEDVTALAFSPEDGKTLASASLDKKVRLWDVAGGKQLRILQGHDKAVWTVAFGPGGKILATGGDEGVVRLWDVDTGKQLHQLKGHAAEIHNVVFSPDGTVLASGGSGGVIQLWDPNTGKELRRWDATARFGSVVAFAPDGKVLASAGGSCIRLWDPATGKEIQPAAGHTGCLRLLRFAPDGKTLFSSAMDKKFLAWDLASGQERLLGVHSLTDAADLSADGKVLAQAVYGDSCIRLWDAVTGMELLALELTAKSTPEVRFSPNGKLLASSSDDGFRLWDLTTGKTLHHIQEKQFSPLAIAFSPDGKLVAFAGNDQTLGLWEVATGKVIRRWERPERFVRILAFAPDGMSLVSYGNPGSDLRVWATATGKLLAQFKGLERILGLAFSPSGRTLVVSDLVRDNYPGPNETSVSKLRFLEALSGQEIRQLEMPQQSVWSLAFAPDGRTLATGGGDSTILVWDMTAGANKGKVPPAALTVADLKQLWADLAGNAPTADRALGTLALSAKQSVPFLAERLRVTAAPAEQVAKLIVALDDKSFAVRDQAFRALVELGEAAEGALRLTLEGQPSLEVRQHIKQILDRRGKDVLRQLRAIDALEQIGTPEARQVLENLAAAPHPQVAFAGRAALQRLAKRAIGKV
jgi:WD40 repeat protein